MSIKLAQNLICDIISADSRQFFKEMSIGTAKPSEKELDSANHHFIDCKSIEEKYSAGQFEKDALTLLDILFSKNKYAIMVGGSGMYIDAVCNGIDEIPSDEKIRAQIISEYTKNGIIPLQEELKNKDIEHYSNMDINNPQRLMRAIEVCRMSGKTYSFFRKQSSKQRPFNIIKIGLTADRELIYSRINKRVDSMIEQGLIEEAQELYPNRNLNALNTVGYKELFKYFDGELSKDEAIEEIKKNTRRFAKRQQTWFNKDKEIEWFDFDVQIDIILSKLLN